MSRTNARSFLFDPRTLVVVYLSMVVVLCALSAVLISVQGPVLACPQSTVCPNNDGGTPGPQSAEQQCVEPISQSGQSGSTVPGSFSAHPIVYLNGVIKYRVSGLVMPSPGLAWTHHPSYNNNPQYGDSNLPNGWNWHTGIPRLEKIPYTSPIEIRVITNAISARKYLRGADGIYYGQDTIRAKIVPKSATKELVLQALDGATFTFYDFDSTQGAKAGQFKKMVDAYGNQITTTYGSNRLTQLTDAGGRSWVYTYISSGVNAGRIAKVEVSYAGAVQAEVDFYYYAQSDAGPGKSYASETGSPGDLMEIIVKEKDSGGTLGGVQRTSAFRYYTGVWSSQNLGETHKLKYIVGPQAYKELAEHGNPLQSTDAVMAEHADYYFEYDSSDRVTKEVVQGTGCSCGTSSGFGTYTYSYTCRSPAPTDYTTWHTQVTQTNPDSSTTTVDVNRVGCLVNEVVQKDGQSWISHYAYDNNNGGRLLQIHPPSACASYSDHSVQPSTSGAVRVFEYDANGNVTYEKLKKVSTGELYFISKREYLSKTFGDNTIYFLQSLTMYGTEATSEASGEPKTTTLSYVFNPDNYDRDGDGNYSEETFAVYAKSKTSPIIAASENGPGTATVNVTYFNAKGEASWEINKNGSTNYGLVYHEYDQTTGALTKTVVDPDSDIYSPPDYTSNPNGLHLETTYRRDVFSYGRLEGVDYPQPGGRKENYYRTHLSGGEYVVAMYPHISGATEAGPVSITVSDHNGKVLTEAKGIPSTRDGNMANDFQQDKATLQEGFQGDLYERTEFVYQHAQVVKRQQCVNAESPNDTNDYTTEYGYDQMGRLARVKDAEGTITRYEYTTRGKLRKTWIGTNDYGSQNPDGESEGTSDMTLVQEQFYDNESSETPSAVGDGNLTCVKNYVSDTVAHTILYGYDWRNRRTSADGEEKYYAKWDYDNVGRSTFSYRYDTSEAGANLRRKSERKYDPVGRLYQEVVYEVDPSSGTEDDSLVAKYWYDNRGRIVKTKEAGGVFMKYHYDRAGRKTAEYVSYDTDEPDTASPLTVDVNGDIVVSEKHYDYDKVDNVLLLTTLERFHTASATGALSASGDPRALRRYVAYWYDSLSRLQTVGNYGTNGGTDLVRSSLTEPTASSATVLITKRLYDEAGRLWKVTGPKGKETRLGYDNLGHQTSTIDNYVDGTPDASDTDQKVEFTYTKISNLKTRKAWMNATDFEETEYVYGVTKGASTPNSKIGSNRLLYAINYPDPSTGVASSAAEDQLVFAYNAQGQMIYRRDQYKSSQGETATEREFGYDGLGQMTSDTAKEVGTGIDSSIRRMEGLYDALGRIISVKSYDATSGGNIKNEVQFVYNGFGDVNEEKQEHTGPVDAATPKVAYSWSEAEDGDPESRLKYIQYPFTDRKVYYVYDRSDGTEYEKLDWILGRVTAIADDNGNGGPSSTQSIHYRYLGLGRVVDKGIERTDSGREMSVAIQYDSQNNTYTGLDRFGRVIELAARDENPDPGQDINRYRYDYDYGSNALWREDEATTYKDEQYVYSDKGDRLTTFKRGELDQNKNIPVSVRSQSWSLDLLGNWNSVTTNQSAVNRVHNKTNEIAEINPGDDPTYDARGNMMQTPPLDRTYTYDAWNRVVEVKDGSASTVTKFSYDGLGRCIRDDTADRDYYYGGDWQLLCERDGDTSTDKTKVEYVWGEQYADEIIARDEDKTGDGDTLDAGDERLYYIQDANWNVVTLCKRDGNAVERYLYDPYGEVTYFDEAWSSRSGSACGNRVLFQGLVWSATAKVCRSRLRDYAPYLGRFLQRDPLGTPGQGSMAAKRYAYVTLLRALVEDLADVNLYEFVGGGPIVMTDPSGGCRRREPALSPEERRKREEDEQRKRDEEEKEMAKKELVRVGGGLVQSHLEGRNCLKHCVSSSRYTAPGFGEQPATGQSTKAWMQYWGFTCYAVRDEGECECDCGFEMVLLICRGGGRACPGDWFTHAYGNVFARGGDVHCIHCKKVTPKLRKPPFTCGDDEWDEVPRAGFTGPAQSYAPMPGDSEAEKQCCCREAAQ